jgi:NAD(P)H-dependent flavin oxidoreductase YrpB (nitropropane dioxygenase family)
LTTFAAGGALIAGAPGAGLQNDEPENYRGVRLQTRLTKEYGIRYPIVSAGMAFVAVPDLAAAVTMAGGLGVLGVAPVGLVNMIHAVKAKTNGMFGVDFINDTSNLGPFTTDDHISACVTEKVPLVIFHWNPPSRAWVDTLHRGGARVWMQTGLTEHATMAVAAGVDGIVAQGQQAGGHVKSEAPTLQILKKLLALVPSSVIVLSSGGIGSGRQMVEALAQGAEEVWIGTRLLASTEAAAHPQYKQRLLQARGMSTEITTIFGPEWPDQPIRVLRNEVVREADAAKSTSTPAVIGNTVLMPFSVPGGVPYTMAKFSAIIPTTSASGDFDQMCLPASDVANSIKTIQPASEIVADIIDEAHAVIRLG